MSNYVSQRRRSRTAVTVIVISLLSAVIFTPEAGNAAVEQISRSVNYTAQNSSSQQEGFTAGADCVYITEQASGNISKPDNSFETVVPQNINSSYSADNLQTGRYTFYSDKMPRKYFRQICLLLDIPPPVTV
jgi:hypothetical protein